MGKHSIADAQSRLSTLIEQAVRGEYVVMTDGDRPIVELTPVASRARTPRQTSPRRVTKEDMDWLREHRVKPLRATEDAGTFVIRMRDEDDERLS